MARARIRRSFNTAAPAATILVRLMVGGVFLSEGIQKFLYADALGVGRFEKIGIPNPEILAPFVGVVEVVCGSLLLLGLFTRLAAVPLFINISVAIVSTKVPILLGHGFWTFSLHKLSRYGLSPGRCERCQSAEYLTYNLRSAATPVMSRRFKSSRHARNET